MHVYFSGIGGTGIGSLALIAHQAGLDVSGSDKQDSAYVRYLQQKGIAGIHIGQTYEQIAAGHAQRPIDWLVYTSALPIEQPDAPELRFCQEHGIPATKRDEFLSRFLRDQELPLIAIAGTHGKTTTTAMTIWLCRQLGWPISYSVGAKLPFGDMGHFTPGSRYFIYEADEYDHNFLSFHPQLSLITGLDWDHPDSYPTRQAYNQAFRQFVQQSVHTVLWDGDATTLGVTASQKHQLIASHDPRIDGLLRLLGKVNRQDAWQVAVALQPLAGQPIEALCQHLNRFPGVSRRFEQLRPGLFSDYAHTPPKIRGALQTAHEAAGDHVVVVYEGLHNTRQHFIKEELRDLFNNVKHVYVVPSYLAREDPSLQHLSPADIVGLLSPAAQAHAQPAQLDTRLAEAIKQHLAAKDVVLCITAGGGHSLDEWLRQTFPPTT